MLVLRCLGEWLERLIERLDGNITGDDRVRDGPGRLAFLQRDQPDVQLGRDRHRRQRLTAVDGGGRASLVEDRLARRGRRRFLLVGRLFLAGGLASGRNEGGQIKLEMVVVGVAIVQQAGGLQAGVGRKGLGGDLPAPLEGAGIGGFPYEADIRRVLVEIPFRISPCRLGGVRHDLAEGELHRRQLERLPGDDGWQRGLICGRRRLKRGRRRQRHAGPGRRGAAPLRGNDAQRGGALAGQVSRRHPHRTQAGQRARRHPHGEPQLSAAGRLGRPEDLDALAEREDGARIQVAAGDQQFVGAAGAQRCGRDGMDGRRQAGSRRRAPRSVENRGGRRHP
jgi:hypothetical protein